MKKFIAIIGIFALVLALASCSNNTSEKSAQPTTEVAPTDTIPVDTTPSEPTTQEVDYTQFSGLWMFSDSSMSTLSLEITGTTAKFHLICISDSDRIAEVSGKAEIINGSIIFYYDNDGWGNAGTLVFEFPTEDSISLEVKDIEADEYAMWSLPEGKHTLLPGEPSSSTESVGDFDDLIGTHQDTYGNGMPIEIRYREDGMAVATLVLPSPIEGVEVVLDGRDGPDFYGYSEDGGSDPACQISFFYDSSCYILTAQIEYYHSSGYYESMLEYVVQ